MSFVAVSLPECFKVEQRRMAVSAFNSNRPRVANFLIKELNIASNFTQRQGFPLNLFRNESFWHLSLISVFCCKTSKTITMTRSGVARRRCHAPRRFPICCIRTKTARYPRSTKVNSPRHPYTSERVIYSTFYPTQSRFTGAVQDISENTQNSSHARRCSAVGVSEAEVVGEFCQFQPLSNRTAHLWLPRMREERRVIFHNQVRSVCSLAFFFD